MVVEGEDLEGWPCIGETGKGDMQSTKPIDEGEIYFIVKKDVYLLLVEMARGEG